MGWGAVVALVVGAISYDQQQSAQSDAKKQQKQMMALQEKNRKEQQAINATQANKERREQIREERIRRARIVQSAQNTGVEGSSGEAGAIAGINTQLGSNLGYNQGMLNASSRMSANSQGIANADAKAQEAQMEANKWGQIGSMSMSIFSANAGGLFGGSGMTQAPAPVETPAPSWKAP